MRMNTIMALMLLSLATLSGCLGFGDDDETSDDHDDECEGLEGAAHDECHDDGHDHGNGTGDDNHTDEPNLPPTASLSMRDADGNALDSRAAVLVGQNITFSANGSADPDGELALAALTVTDGNGTRTVSMLANGVLTDVELPIAKEGPVTAVLRILDDDGDGAVAANFTYANEVQTKSGTEDAPAPPTGVQACRGPTSATGTLVDDKYSTSQTFKTVNGTQWISAVVVSGNVEITICDPDGNALSETGTEVSTEQDNYPPGVNHYLYIVNDGTGATSWTVEWISHWEPKPAE